MVILGFLTGMITEILGVQRGWIFGDYKYGNALGYKILGVPMLIGVNWALLTIITAAIAQQFYENLFMRIVIGVCLMIFLDLLIEPIAPVLDFWAFEGGNAPLQNYIGWTAVAIFLQSKSKKNSIIFRHHPKSSAQKEKDFESLINVFDFKLEENAIFFDYLDPFLKNFDVYKRKIIGTSFLCFLEKAVYDLIQSSHYALAFEKYLHFTSPIRRYPDLINHRVLKKIVKNETVAKLDPSVTAIINNRENEVEEIHYYYKNLFNLIKFYNTKPINKVLIGIITGVSDFGIFITLRDFDVTGLLHKRNIKILEFQKHKIKILHHGEVLDLRIFDEVSVKIRSLEILNLKVDLSLKK